jgi:hypothetical protein
MLVPGGGRELSLATSANWKFVRSQSRRTSAGSGSSRDRTILSRTRVCDYWGAMPYPALAGELRARGGRFRDSGCRARFAGARGRL